jgi:gluconolactonase
VRALLASLAVTAGLALCAAPAAAVPDCASLPAKRVVATAQGTLESIISDHRGRLFYTETDSSRVVRIDRPGAVPHTLVEGIDGLLAVALDFDQSLVLGFGNSTQEAAANTGDAGLMRLDPDTGKKGEVITRGMDQSNGVVRGPDGAWYASNDFGGGIDRFFGGRVTDNWAEVETPNGLVFDRAGRYLFAAQTFKPASVARIELAHPERVTPYAEATGPDITGGPDGLTRDGADRLFMTVNGAGEVWRIDTDRSICALARGLPFASSATFGGGGSGFPSRNLYVVGFDGNLVELANATDRAREPAPRPRLRLGVRPRRVRAGRTSRFAMQVTGALGSWRGPVGGAVIRFGGRRASTDARGTASLRVRFHRTGLRRAVASRRGYRSATAAVRVLRRR